MRARVLSLLLAVTGLAACGGGDPPPVECTPTSCPNGQQCNTSTGECEPVQGGIDAGGGTIDAARPIDAREPDAQEQIDAGGGGTIDAGGGGGAPDTEITSQPPALTSSTNATFSFTSTISGSSFRCRLDTGALLSCSSPHALTGLSSASHTFSVFAISPGGLSDSTPDTYTWTVDTTPPDTTGTGPSGNVTNSDANITFTSPDTSATFECNLDNTSYAACTSPVHYSGLAAGVHTFSVRAVDLAGNVDPVPYQLTWNVTNPSPDTTITSTLANPNNLTAVPFTFTANLSGSTFECSIDGSAYAVCTSGQTFAVSTEGSHTFGVRGVSSTGNADPSPATAAWSTDLTAPNTTIVDKPALATQSGSASFTYTSTETDQVFECSIDGAAFSTCPAVGISYSGRTEDSHTFQVRALDAVGNYDATPATYTWVVDATKPVISITGGPSGTSGSATATFTFSANESGVVFSCSIDGGAFATCVSPKAYPGLLEDAHTFTIRGTDAAGNVSDDVIRTWTIDTSLPVVTLTGQPANPTTSQTAAFTFTSNEVGSTFECRLDAAAFASCPSSGITYNSVAEGTHSFQVRAIDTGGNTGGATTYTWTIDRTAPTVSITMLPTSPSTAATAPTTVAFTANTEAGATVRFYTVGTCTGTPTNTGTANSGGTYVTNLAVTGNTTTIYYVTVSDGLNTSACTSFSFIHDNVAPTLGTLTSTPTSPSTAATPPTTIVLNVPTEPGATVRIFSNNTCTTEVQNGVAPGGGTYNSSPLNVTANASTTYYVRVSDAYSNATACTAYTFTHDNQPPVVSLVTFNPSTPSNAATPPTTAIMTVNTDTPSAVVRIYSNVGCSTELNSGNANGSGVYTSSSLSVGANTTTNFYVRVFDALNNGTACTLSTFVHDNTGPTISGIVFSPTSPSIATTPPTTATMTVTTNQPSATVRVYSNSTCATELTNGTANGSGVYTSANLTVGANTTTTFYVRAFDSLLNPSACTTAAFVHDNIGPTIVGITSTPASPSNAPTPPTTITLTVDTNEAGAVVTIYSGNTCTGSLNSGTANGSGDYTSGNLNVGANATTTFYVKATDALTNGSTCTAFSFLHDNSVPTISSVVYSPASPNNSTTAPTTAVMTVNTQAGATVTVYSNSTCTTAVSGASGTANGSGVYTSPALPVGANTTTNYYVRAFDALLNGSPCTNYPFIHDNTPPTVSSVVYSPASPSNAATRPTSATMTINTNQAGAAIGIYSTNTCTGTAAASGTANGSGTYTSGSLALNTTAPGADGVTITNYYVQAADQALPAPNKSACTLYPFIHDNVGPTVSSVVLSTGALSNSSNTPTATVTVTEAATVRIFTTNINCTGDLAGTPAAIGATTSNVYTSPAITLLTNRTQTVYVTARDAAGNCGAGSTTFQHDNRPPTFTAMTETAQPTTLSGVTPTFTSRADWTAVDANDDGGAPGTATTGLRYYRCTTSVSATACINAASPTLIGTNVLTLTSTGNKDQKYYPVYRVMDAAGNFSEYTRTLQDAAGTPYTATGTYVRMEGDTAAVDVKMNFWHACALLVDGTVHCWGRNDNGQVGNGTTGPDVLVPTKVNLPTTARKISVGSYHTCAILTDGRLACWGQNDAGQLGTGASGASTGVPQIVNSVGSFPGGLTEVSAGHRFTCIGDRYAYIWCVGANDYGQLGDVQTVPSSTPKVTWVKTDLVPSSGSGYYSLSAGIFHACAIYRGNGDTYCWGLNSSGETGNGNTTSPVTAPAVVNFPAGVRARTIHAGYYHSCAATTDNKSYCWGANSASQLGNGLATGTYSSPQPSGVNFVSKVTTNYEHTCALNNEGEVLCWGSNTDGALGNTVAGNSNVAVFANFGGSYDNRAIALATGFNSSCVVTLKGRVRCWGLNTGGQHGVGNATAVAQGVIQQAVGPFGVTGAKQTDAGRLHSCSVLSNGEVWCWGQNNRGQLGNGTLVTSPLPVPAGATTMVRVSVGNEFTCAEGGHGYTFCWGANDFGQLGYNAIGTGTVYPHGTDSASPACVRTSVGGGCLLRLTGITAGGEHACGLHGTSSEPYCWGSGGDYRLGGGSSAAPSIVPLYLGQRDGAGTHNWVETLSIDAGEGHTCLVSGYSDATANRYGWTTCWGRNTDLQSGVVGGAPVIMPSTTTSIHGSGKEIGAGYAHSCSRDYYGYVYCWGSDAYGQHGNDAVIGSASSASPRMVTTASLSLSVGGWNACITARDNQVPQCWGYNSLGTLGINNTTDQPGMVNVIDNAVDDIGAVGMSGGYVSCFQTVTGKVLCSGYNGSGALGDGTINSSNTMVPVRYFP
jgi:alpha-tubulin suppressor-like RCC1 family protein